MRCAVDGAPKLFCSSTDIYVPSALTTPFFCAHTCQYGFSSRSLFRGPDIAISCLPLAATASCIMAKTNRVRSRYAPRRYCGPHDNAHGMIQPNFPIKTFAKHLNHELRDWRLRNTSRDVICTLQSKLHRFLSTKPAAPPTNSSNMIAQRCIASSTSSQIDRVE